MGDHYKHPRLHVDQSLGAEKIVPLPEAQAHYLRNVLRKNAGDQLRLFNEKDGEWLAVLSATEKKSAIAICQQQLRGPQTSAHQIHLLFPPLAKDRLDFLIEKAVELGVTDLHPLTTQRSEIRKLNDARVKAQIIEAAEQCERHDIPALHEMSDLPGILSNWDETVTLYAALERTDAQPLAAHKGPCALLIGPPGGFSEDEKVMLGALPFVHAVTLGERILRTETAALYGLARLSA